MTDPYTTTLIAALDKAERQLAQAAGALRQAQAIHEVEVVKYAALRDAAAEQYSPAGNDSPYLHPEDWPPAKGNTRGRFRFIRMQVGDAAVLALRQAGEPMTAVELVQYIKRGGGRINLRALNAALQQKAGIKKTVAEGEDGLARYSYDDLDPEDLPF